MSHLTDDLELCTPKVREQLWELEFFQLVKPARSYNVLRGELLVQPHTPGRPSCGPEVPRRH